MNTAPVYLLLNGEATGPHAAEEIIRKLYPDTDEGELLQEALDENTLSCVEGMPGWRTLPETLVWSCAKLLNCLPAQEWIEALANTEIQIRDIDIRRALQKATGCDDVDNLDYIQTALEVNAYLLKHHRQYQKREGEWQVDAFDYYPARELFLFGKQRFKRDWPTDWVRAGGKLYDGKMVARIDDPVWSAISDFGYPLMPFSFDLGMWIQAVTMEEAREIGLISGPVTLLLPMLKPWKIVGL